eukprot:scaffold41725_cov59-Phaeocystis_antarctica.AAC.1
METSPVFVLLFDRSLKLTRHPSTARVTSRFSRLSSATTADSFSSSCSALNGEGVKVSETPKPVSRGDGDLAEPASGTFGAFSARGKRAVGAPSGSATCRGSDAPPLVAGRAPSAISITS